MPPEGRRPPQEEIPPEDRTPLEPEVAPKEEGRRSLAGRAGGAATRLDRLLSQKLPAAIERSVGRLGQWARSRLMSGHWQDYAFLVFAALVVLAVGVLAARGCQAVLRP